MALARVAVPWSGESWPGTGGVLVPGRAGPGQVRRRGRAFAGVWLLLLFQFSQFGMAPVFVFKFVWLVPWIWAGMEGILVWCHGMVVWLCGVVMQR